VKEKEKEKRERKRTAREGNSGQTPSNYSRI
jgi:hypothetical protein